MTGNVIALIQPKPVRRLPEMRRLIGGCIYDTTTASVLHHWKQEDDWCFFDRGDGTLTSFRYDGKPGELAPCDVGEALCVTKRDVFFLASYCDGYDPWSDDAERITPVTRVEAIEWLLKHAGLDTVESYFGRMPEVGEAEPYTPVPPAA